MTDLNLDKQVNLEIENNRKEYNKKLHNNAQIGISQQEMRVMEMIRCFQAQEESRLNSASILSAYKELTQKTYELRPQIAPMPVLVHKEFGIVSSADRSLEENLDDLVDNIVQDIEDPQQKAIWRQAFAATRPLIMEAILNAPKQALAGPIEIEIISENLSPEPSAPPAPQFSEKLALEPVELPEIFFAPAPEPSAPPASFELFESAQPAEVSAPVLVPAPSASSSSVKQKITLNSQNKVDNAFMNAPQFQSLLEAS